MSINKQYKLELQLIFPINQMNKPAKNKLKTLPNELSNNQQQYLFQSQCDDALLKKFNLASPTFATHELNSNKKNEDRQQGLELFPTESKQNKISLSLKEMRFSNNADSKIKNLSKNCKETDNCLQSNKINEAFLKGQNEKLVQKCKMLDQSRKELEEENKILKQKLKICKKCVQQKFNQVVKYMQMPNSSTTESNIDLYLELKSFKDHYKELNDACQMYEKQNNLLTSKIQQLQLIITNYTQKPDIKKQQKVESSAKAKELEKSFQEKVQQNRRKTQSKIKQMDHEIKEIQKKYKKMKDEYEKVKFLKEEIEKKRQEDLRVREQLEQELKTKQEERVRMKQLLGKVEQEKSSLQSKVQANSKSSQSFEEQLSKYLQDMSKLSLQKTNIQNENNKLKYSNQSLKMMNEKYSQQLDQLRKQNHSLFQSSQILKFQKDRLEITITRFNQTQQRYNKRIKQLEIKLAESEKQLDDAKFNLEQMSKNSSRSQQGQQHDHEISKFKESDDRYEKPSTFRLMQNENEKYLEQQEKRKQLEQKFTKIVEVLNIEIESLRKEKQSLLVDLETERQKNFKINIELENTHRRFQQFSHGHSQHDFEKEFPREDFREKERVYKRELFSNTNQLFPFEITRSTKAAPQLKMIKEILLTILSIKDSEKNPNRIYPGIFREKQREFSVSADFLIDDIKRLAEQTADLFDDKNKQIQCLLGRIENKQQVISKLLRFTPQQKKTCILDYLKVMQNIDQFSADQVYKVTKTLEQQAAEWRKTVSNLIETIHRNQQELLQMKKQTYKYKSDAPSTRKYDQSFATSNAGRDRFQDRYQQKYQYRRFGHN